MVSLLSTKLTHCANCLLFITKFVCICCKDFFRKRWVFFAIYFVMLIRSADYISALPLATFKDLRANQEKTKYGNAEDATGKVIINHSPNELLILTVTWL